jgi:FkbH-like protein
VQERRKVESTTESPIEYLQVLEAKITLISGVDVPAERASQLSKKTNQFNTNFMRFGEADVLQIQSNPTQAVVCVSYEDKLSDSGIIGLFVGRFVPEENGAASMDVEEIALSCRSLGRGVESLVIAHGLLKLGNGKATLFSMRFVDADRNLPAKKWLDKNCERSTTSGGIRYTISQANLAGLTAPFQGVVQIEFK